MISEWAKNGAVTAKTILRRILSGIPPEQAISSKRGQQISRRRHDTHYQRPFQTHAHRDIWKPDRSSDKSTKCHTVRHSLYDKKPEHHICVNGVFGQVHQGGREVFMTVTSISEERKHSGERDEAGAQRQKMTGNTRRRWIICMSERELVNRPRIEQANGRRCCMSIRVNLTKSSI